MWKGIELFLFLISYNLLFFRGIHDYFNVHLTRDRYFRSLKDSGF